VVVRRSLKLQRYFPVWQIPSDIGHVSVSSLFDAGAKNEANGLVFKELLQTPNFRITVVEESDTVELCGALKVTNAA